MKIIPIAASPACGPDSPGGRLLLPVAPRANHRLRFAPPETGAALLPAGALVRIEEVLAKGQKIAALEIAGPGDPLADPEPVLATLRLVRHNHPALPLHLATVGLGGEGLAATLAAAGVSRLILLVLAATPETAAKLYAWIRPGTKTIPLPEAARLLVDEQTRTVAACRHAGLAVEIRTTVLPGYNEGESKEIAGRMAALGATTMTLVPFMPAVGGEEAPAGAAPELLARLQTEAAHHLPTVVAREDCRAMAGGYPGPLAGGLPGPTRERPNVAVVSSNGMDIDLHLGQAITLLIYGPREDGLPSLLETRPAPEPGGGASRWETLAAELSDCFALLTASAGESPRSLLGRQGIRVMITDGEVESTVDVLYGGGRKRKK